MGHGKGGGGQGGHGSPNILLRKALFFYKLFSSFLSIFSFTIIIIKKYHLADNAHIGYIYTAEVDQLSLIEVAGETPRRVWKVQ